MKDRSKVAIFGIGCITALEITALVTAHIDGAVLSTIVGMIAGIVGYSYGIQKGGGTNA